MKHILIFCHPVSTRQLYALLLILAASTSDESDERHTAGKPSETGTFNPFVML